MQTIRVTQVTEIEVSDENVKLLLSELKHNLRRNSLSISNDIAAVIINYEANIDRPNLTISDLEKSGEII